MRNPRSAMTKQIKKSDMLVAKRTKDDVYLFTGSWILKTDIYAYETQIRPYNMRLLKLEDGDIIESKRKTEQCEPVENDRHPEKLFPNGFNVDVFSTPLKILLNSGNIKEARILKSDNAHWLINEDYMQMAEEIIPHSVKAQDEKPFNPLLFENENEEKLLILPINPPEQAKDWIYRI